MPTQPTRQHLRGSTKLLYDELTTQGANPVVLDASPDLVQYTDQSGATHTLFYTCSDTTSAAGHAIASSKSRTELIARRLDIPTPPSIVCTTIEDARDFLATHQRIVTKPRAKDGGRGVSIDITTDKTLYNAYEYARSYGQRVIAQSHVDGVDVRLLTVGGTFVSAVIREPAAVIGDGLSTVEQLIVETNALSPRNDPAFMSILPIQMQAARQFLGEAMQAIPGNDEKNRTTGPSNVSLGGTLIEATHLVSPAMIADAEKISQSLRIDLCGVDMMWDQKKNRYYLIEINTTPGIDIHNDPFSGTSSDCVRRYVQWLVRR